MQNDPVKHLSHSYICNDHVEYNFRELVNNLNFNNGKYKHFYFSTF